MARNIGEPVQIKRKSGAGAFFGGTFLGFILGIAALVGLCAFAYFKVSVNWINKNFKTDINLGSEELNNKTLSNIVSAATGLIKNIDNYSFNTLKSDFGIEINDKVAGIDISDLKSVPLKDLSEAVKNKFANISAKELEDVFTSEGLDKIMDKTITYYFDGEKLYKNFNGTTYSNEVDFDYEIVGGSLKIKNFNLIDINSGKAEVTLKYLPITTAVADFTANLGDNITLEELDRDYGVRLPSYIYNATNKTKTVNQVEEIINSVKLSEVLNLTYDSTKQLYVDNGGVEMPYVVNALADTEIQQIPTKFKTLTITELFKTKPPVLSLVPANTTLDLLPQAIQDAVTQTSINDLKQAGVITINAADAAKLTVEVDHDNDSTTEKEEIGSLTIDELFDYCFDLIVVPVP